MTVAHPPRPELRTFDSVDPTPMAPEGTPRELEARLFDYTRPVFERMRALFTLRALGTTEAVHVLARCLAADPSALVRHEVAFVLGQMQDPLSASALREAILKDPHPMVRHEAVEALGNLGDDGLVPFLERVQRTDPSVEVRESAEIAIQNIRYLWDPNEF